MIHLSIYSVPGTVVWHMAALRPAADWKRLGPWYWDRRGAVQVDEMPTNHREEISIALRAIQDRLGER